MSSTRAVWFPPREKPSGREGHTASFGRSAAGTRRAKLVISIDRITNRKQTAFAMNTKFDPADETKKPPNAGPRIPDKFSCKPLKVGAESSSVSETTCGTIEVQVGALKAKPTPIKERR